jgi:hypothetical protein
MVFTQAEENFYVNKGLASLEPNDIEKLKLQGDVVLGDFIFNTIDDQKVVWVLTDIDGWWTAPPSDVKVIERGFGDGSYDVAGRYKSRPLNLEVVLLTDDPKKVEAARDRLIATCDLVRTGAWLKTGTSPIRASYVFLNGDVEIDTVNARGRTRFRIPLRASDPIKYAWNDEDPQGYELVELAVKNAETGESGVAVIQNIGNYPVPCVFEITGPFSGPGSVFNRSTGELVILTQSLKGRLARAVVNKELEFSIENPNLTDVVTLTTTEPHDFSVGNSVFVSGVGEPFDGDQVITSIPTSTTFTYNVSAADIRPVSFKSFDTNTATLETTVDHGFQVDDVLLIVGVDGLFDTLRARVTSVPTPRSFTYAASRSTPQTLSSSQLTSNIATLSTTQEHGFIVGEQVTVAGAGVNYNGTFEITEIPSPNSFSYAATRTNSRQLTRVSMSDDVVTFTTSTTHGFVPDEGVNISGVNLSLNGGYLIENTTGTTFSYTRPRATLRRVTVKALSSNVATITTSEAHGFVVGEKVRIVGVDPQVGGGPQFDGVYTITSLPSNTSFTYNKTGSNIVSTSVFGGFVSAKSRKVRNRELIGNVATLITDAAHGAIFGERITVTGMGAPFDGTHTVTGIPFLNVINFTRTHPNIELEKPFALEKASRTGGVAEITTRVAHGYSVGQAIRVSGIDSSFDGTYTITAVPSPTKIRYSTPGGGEVPEEDVPNGSEVIKDFGFVEMSGTIPAQNITGGLATVGGSLPFSAVSGTASVSNVVSRRPAAGNAIKRNNVQFTPGITGATAVVGSDILEIDTKDHVVAFNGFVEGARGRVDVLADFIKLKPGENIIEFEDTGNPDGEANLRIFYRSGWLG